MNCTDGSTQARDEPLLTAVRGAFADSEGGHLSTDELYAAVARRVGLPLDVVRERVPIGKDGALHSPWERAIRWQQQTLRQRGILERAPGQRGVWRLTAKGRQLLTPALPRRVMVAFCTKLGVALWADCRDAFMHLNEPISLCLTSPPYPLSRPRCYGNPPLAEYVGFLCSVLEPIVRHLQPGGSVALVVSNDIFEPGLPSRSLYLERLSIALHDQLGLHKMDTMIWYNRSKPPGPVQWASLRRIQLNAAYEPILWFTNDPLRCLADNRRVLEPHTERHRRFLARDRSKDRAAERSDGAHNFKTTSYRKATPGRIPRNVMDMGHTCQSQKQYKALARAAGLPAHGAPLPLKLADTLVRFLCPPDGLTVDPMGGSMTVPLAAENNHRRWIASEMCLEYLLGARHRFSAV